MIKILLLLIARPYTSIIDIPLDHDLYVYYVLYTTIENCTTLYCKAWVRIVLKSYTWEIISALLNIRLNIADEHVQQMLDI